MKLFVVIVGSLLLLSVAAFCLFGFLATFEPTANTTQFMVFRIGYAAVGVAFLISAAADTMVLPGDGLAFSVHGSSCRRFSPSAPAAGPSERR